MRSKEQRYDLAIEIEEGGRILKSTDHGLSASELENRRAEIRAGVKPGSSVSLTASEAKRVIERRLPGGRTVPAGE